MKDETFQELLLSVKQGGAILRAEMPASQTFTFESQDMQNIQNFEIDIASETHKRKDKN